MKRIAMVSPDDTLENMAVWDGITEWKPEDYTLVDVTEQPEVAIGHIFHLDTITFTSHEIDIKPSKDKPWWRLPWVKGE